jgi:hypothetical protein
MPAAKASSERLADRPGAWVDLGLTLPIFLLYHLTVVFLGVQNATDVVTGTLLRLAGGDRGKYLLATLAIGTIFAGTFALLGRGQAFHPRKFVQITLESVLYAILMRVTAAAVVGRLFMGPSAISEQGRLVGFVMSLGAGFYEELTFRAVLFGLGAKVLVWLFARQRVELTATTPAARYSLRAVGIMLGWSVASALVFSAVHYFGPLADSFDVVSFSFRALLGIALTVIYVSRGFAAAVWTHAAYDVWVLVVR